VKRQAEIRHTYAVIDGVRIHSLEQGLESSRPPVVLLHGLNDCHLTWNRVAPELARDRRVLIPDLPGHGLSERPDASYELAWYAGVMSGWLQTMGLEQVDIVGHSLGGGVAQMMLLRCAERIRRLALVSSGGLGREVGFLLRLAAIPRMVEWFGQPFMSPCTRLAMLGMLDKGHIDELCAINASAGSARTFGRTVRDIISLSGQKRMFFQRAHEIAELPPIAVLWGDRDKIIPFDHASAFAGQVDGVQVTIFPGCGHHIHHEAPERLVSTLRAFFDLEQVCNAKLLASRDVAGPNVA
jgi:pimeloyl-ACP methyl ester carboxylesterase